MSSGQLPRKWKFSDSSDKDPKINASLCILTSIWKFRKEPKIPALII